jgi:integral membrane protein
MTFLQALRRLAIIEGISTLVLFFVAMPMKYFAGIPLAVTIVGAIHGALFVALGVMFLIAIRRVPITLGTAATGVVAAILPGGPFVFDRRLRRLESRER